MAPRWKLLQTTQRKLRPLSRTKCLGGAPSLVSIGVGALRVKIAIFRRRKLTIGFGREGGRSRSETLVKLDRL
jgi:hypothetical protein